VSPGEKPKPAACEIASNQSAVNGLSNGSLLALRLLHRRSSSNRNQHCHPDRPRKTMMLRYGLT